MRSGQTVAIEMDTLGIAIAGTGEAMRKIREKVTFMETDRPIYKDMDKIGAMIRSGEIIEAVEAVIGVLK